ncbi:hypothetical protein AB6B38_12090 [Glycocaulis abyssi]|uniref:Uncharacterized protein n=1 Tax=Glycocaulis abyssi TaxID=1433403 RepID=A0ABV9NG36_9PROT
MLATLAVVFGASLALARQDAAGGADHPLIARYDGSVIIAHHASAFDEFDIATGPHTSFEPTLTDYQTVEGAWTRLLYVAPEGRSTLDVVRNYAASLTELGFQELFTCRGRECGMGPDPARAGSAIIRSALLPREDMRRFGRTVEFAFTQPQDVRFLSARLDRPEGAVYVSLAVAIEAFDNFRLTANRVLILLDVIEAGELDESMVRVDQPVQPDEVPAAAAAPEPDFGTFTPPEIPDLYVPPGGAAPANAPSLQDVLDQIYSPEMEAMRREAEEQLDAVLRARARPDPVIANLTPEDRDQVMALVELVNDFAAEIRDRQARFDTELFDARRPERLLEEAFNAEGAERRSRYVALDNLPTASRSDSGPPVHIPSILGGTRRADYLNLKQDVVHCFENMVPHQVAAHTIDACARYWADRQPGVRPENCLFHPNNQWNDRNDIICHTLDQPHDWILSSYGERDWFEDKLDQRVMVDNSEVVQPGELPNRLRVQNAVYSPYISMLEALSRSIGSRESSISIFTIGLRTHGDPRRFSDDDPDFLAAGLNADNEYVLHPAMREALTAMQDYMTEARDSWRTYEAAIYREWPVLHATALARRDAYAQSLGRLQEPLYAQLLEVWNATPRVHYAAPELTPIALQDLLREAQRESQTRYTAFVNRNTRALAEIERLRDCIRAFDSPFRENRIEWDRRIFHNPLFIIVEAAGELEPHSELLLPLQHERGQTDGLAVARPANGVHNMPAWGGIRLAECGLIIGPPEDSGGLEISGADAPEDPTPLLRLAIAVFPDEPVRPTVDEDGLGPELTEPRYEPVASIHYGHPVHIEAVFETAQPLETYRVAVETPFGRTDVVVERTEDDPLLYRSGPLVFAHADGRSAERSP